MKIYVASSWRNEKQPRVVERLREVGHEVYDFRHPEPGNDGFHWSEIDTYWEKWTPRAFRAALPHKLADCGFRDDFQAMKWADAFVLVLPCGRSAHLELGWAVGVGKKTIILLDSEDFEPELMYKMVDHLCVDLGEVIEALKK